MTALKQRWVKGVAWWHAFLVGMLEGSCRQVMIAFQVAFMLIGMSFWIVSGYTDAAFSEETWGRICLSQPAEFWAGLMMIQSTLTFVGLLRPVMWLKIAIGSSIAVIHFSVVAYSAFFTGGEFVIGVYAAVMMVPMHWLLAAAAIYRGRP